MRAVGSFFLRMGWDSNPRKGLTFGGFQDRCIKPLCHPSGDLQAQWRAGENTSACIAQVQAFFVACRRKWGIYLPCGQREFPLKRRGFRLTAREFLLAQREFRGHRPRDFMRRREKEESHRIAEGGSSGWECRRPGGHRRPGFVHAAGCGCRWHPERAR